MIRLETAQGYNVQSFEDKAEAVTSHGDQTELKKFIKTTVQRQTARNKCSLAIALE